MNEVSKFRYIQIMSSNNRREFLKKTVTGTAGLIIGAPLVKDAFAGSPNDRINIAVVGIRSRGAEHYRQFSQIPNVRVTTICDVDERLFPKAVNEVKEFSGEKPKTVVDFREVLEDESINAVSLATPDHWHALHAIWACQAGKDVYVEKPVSYTIEEGRKMVEAARKYKRVVQVGTQSRSDQLTREAIKFLHDGKLGDIYLARGAYVNRHVSFGKYILPHRQGTKI